MNKLAKLLEKKKQDGGMLSDVEKDAKMSVLHDLRNQAADAMRAGLKKVTVASNSPEGLKAGLDKAKDMVDGAGSNPGEYEDEDGEANPKHEDPMSPNAHQMGQSLAQEGSDEEAQEHEGSYDEQASKQGAGTHEELPDDELDQKIAELMAEKERRLSK